MTPRKLSELVVEWARIRRNKYVASVELPDEIIGRQARMIEALTDAIFELRRYAPPAAQAEINELYAQAKGIESGDAPEEDK